MIQEDFDFSLAREIECAAKLIQRPKEPAMKHLQILAAVVVLLAPTAAGTEEASAKKASLTVEVEGFASREGMVRLAVFRTPEGWPRDPAKVFRTASVPVKTPVSTVVFDGLDPATYAVSAYHDENANGKLDRNFLGMPTEDYGFSNNARATFGPPDFEEAAFSLPASGKTIRIRVE